MLRHKCTRTTYDCTWCCMLGAVCESDCPNFYYLLRIIYIRYIHRNLHTISTYKYRIYIIRSRYKITVDGEPVEVKDRLGRTALDVAVGQKHLACCAEIVRIRHNRRLHSEWMSRSARASASLPRAKSECTATNGQFLVGGNGWTLLHAATQMGLVDTVKLTLEKSDDREVALRAKARDLSMTCSWTPAMLAVPALYNVYTIYT